MQTSWQLLLTKRAGGLRLRVLLGRQGAIFYDLLRAGNGNGNGLCSRVQEIVVLAMFRQKLSWYRCPEAIQLRVRRLILHSAPAANYFPCKAKPACLLVSLQVASVNAEPQLKPPGNGSGFTYGNPTRA